MLSYYHIFDKRGMIFMSLLDKYAEYKSNASQRGNTVTRRYMDPDFLTPDVFFMMDEIKGRQILRKYNKASGMTVYAGTYHVIFKTEDMGRFCLIMRRIKNEWPVPEEYMDLSELEQNTYIVSEYYPGTHMRIYLRGLGEAALDRVVKEYERKTRKKLTLK